MSIPAETESLLVTCHATIGTATPIDVSAARGGRILNNSGGQVIFDYHESDDDVTYAQCTDVGQITVEDGESVEIDSKLFGCTYLKLVKSAGNADLTVTLKW